MDECRISSVGSRCFSGLRARFAQTHSLLFASYWLKAMSGCITRAPLGHLSPIVHQLCGSHQFPLPAEIFNPLRSLMEQTMDSFLNYFHARKASFGAIPQKTCVCYPKEPLDVFECFCRVLPLRFILRASTSLPQPNRK